MHRETIEARAALLDGLLDEDGSLDWEPFQQELLGLRRGGFFDEPFTWPRWNDERHMPVNGKWKSPTHLLLGWANDVMTLDQKGVVLYGPVGVGKTHLAVMVGVYLVVRHRMRRPFYVDWSVFSDDLRSASGGVDNGAYERLEALHHADFLVIDDLGAERPSEFALSKLFGLLNRRRTPFIVTMNIKPDEWLANIRTSGSAVRSDDTERVVREAERVARRLSRKNGYVGLYLPIANKEAT